MMDQRQHVRQPVDVPGKLDMTLIPYEKPEKIDIIADAVDRGEGGMGIITDRALTLGFVVIRDERGGIRNGVLVWTTQRGERSYRAGIQIVPTHETKPEAAQAAQPGVALPALQDPDLFASILVDLMDRGMRNGPRGGDRT